MIVVLLVLWGLCFGSFVNALVWRLYTQPKAKSMKLKASDLSVLKGRSMCVHCHHTLAWYDLVPVISWLVLGGKCRYCNKPVSWQYPLVELSTATMFIVSYIFWPHGFDLAGIVQFVYWLIFLVGFIALMVYDFRWMRLPNKIVYPLLWLAVSQVIIISAIRGDISGLLVAAFGSVALGGLFYCLFQISAGKWIGGGDVKLGFVLGLLAGGFLESMLILFIASIIGTLGSLPMLTKGKKGLKKRIPFGPMLILGCLIVYLFGASILDWYMNLVFIV